APGRVFPVADRDAPLDLEGVELAGRHPDALPAQHPGLDLYRKTPAIPGIDRDRFGAPGLARRQRKGIGLVGRLVFEGLQVGRRPPQPVPFAVVDLFAIATLHVAGDLDTAAGGADDLVPLVGTRQAGEAVADAIGPVVAGRNV